MKPLRRSNVLPSIAMVVLTAFCLLVAAPAWSQQSSTDISQGTAGGVGMQASSVLATVLYAPLKFAFAIGGGIVGGLAYAFSGGNETTAKGIWIPSMYGTYLITPEHLTGEKPVRFLGVAAETGGPRSDSSAMIGPVPEPVR